MTSILPSGSGLRRTSGASATKLPSSTHMVTWYVMRMIGDALGRDALQVANALEIQCAAIDGLKTRPHEIVWAETSNLAVALTNKSLELTNAAPTKTVAVSTNSAAGRGEGYVRGTFYLKLAQSDAGAADVERNVSITFQGWEQEDRTVFLASGREHYDLNELLPEWSGVLGAGTIVFNAIGLAAGDTCSIGFEGRAAGLRSETDFATNREFFAAGSPGSIQLGGALKEMVGKMSARVQKDVTTGLGNVASKLGIGSGNKPGSLGGRVK